MTCVSIKSGRFEVSGCSLLSSLCKKGGKELVWEPSLGFNIPIKMHSMYIFLMQAVLNFSHFTRQMMRQDKLYNVLVATLSGWPRLIVDSH